MKRSASWKCQYLKIGFHIANQLLLESVTYVVGDDTDVWVAYFNPLDLHACLSMSIQASSVSSHPLDGLATKWASLSNGTVALYTPSIDITCSILHKMRQTGALSVNIRCNK